MNEPHCIVVAPTANGPGVALITVLPKSQATGFVVLGEAPTDYEARLMVMGAIDAAHTPIGRAVLAGLRARFGV